MSERKPTPAECDAYRLAMPSNADISDHDLDEPYFARQAIAFASDIIALADRIRAERKALEGEK